MAQIIRPTEVGWAGYYVAARYGFPREYIEYHKTLTLAPGRGNLTGRVLREGKPHYSRQMMLRSRSYGATSWTERCQLRERSEEIRKDRASREIL